MIKGLAGAAAGAWVMTFLLYTPRGERILVRTSRILFPEKICR